MFISAAEFSAGAVQLVEAWKRVLPGEPAWRWVAARQAFAAAMGGGYLAMQRDMVPPAAAPPPAQHPAGAHGEQAAAAAQGPAAEGQAQSSNGRRSSGAVAAATNLEDGTEELECDAADLDPADARQALALGSSGGGCGRPAGGAADDAAAHAARLALTCHVAYHLSYRVPVLYFEASGPDGVPVGLDALLQALPRLREALSGGPAGTVVTQEEHPFLSRPCFMLHPCQTGAIMQLVMEGGVSLLLLLPHLSPN
ncbi:hypothetical protein ABPG75_003428 [Micractinium tetrahymenae]